MTLDIEYFKANTKLLHDEILKRLELHILDKDLRKFYDRYEKENTDKNISFDLWFFSIIANEEASAILSERKKDYTAK
ncbi:MAG: hypothetical protein QG567_1900 [Campylobacterota bacterium]|nr:hypothetical protein [Campylobacterota bacterium]